MWGPPERGNMAVNPTTSSASSAGQTCGPHIVIPIDESKPSTWAVIAGGQLAAELGACVTLLHVVLPPNALPTEFGPMPDDIDVLCHRGIRLLARASRLLPDGVRPDLALREGVPAAQIVEVARERGGDLIVMGTRGMGRIARLLLGSTAEAVIHAAPCPVITVCHPPDVARSSSGTCASAEAAT
jgi:nucleotide-binding universal stress UspA family protein